MTRVVISRFSSRLADQRLRVGLTYSTVLLSVFAASAYMVAERGPGSISMSTPGPIPAHVGTLPVTSKVRVSITSCTDLAIISLLFASFGSLNAALINLSSSEFCPIAALIRLSPRIDVFISLLVRS